VPNFKSHCKIKLEAGSWRLEAKIMLEAGSWRPEAKLKAKS